MDKRTADALELSIAHWERNVAAETPDDASVSAKCCALCITFRPTCAGCPVKDETGQTDCEDSPYEQAFERFILWMDHDRSAHHLLAWRAAAQCELDFLKGLRVEAEGTEK